jgi:hypothetical protein
LTLFDPAPDLEAEMASGAVLSTCGRYRYALRRSWAPGPMMTWVMLNPSTADATVNDPTIRTLISFGRAWGMGSLAVVNLFAWRATKPRDLLGVEDPVGPENAAAIARWVDLAHLVMVGWGNGPGGRRMDDLMAQAVASLVATGHRLECLGTNANGSPWHPLFRSPTLRPQPWR